MKVQEASSLVSVVIGFKDRGLGRLTLCVESIHASLREIPHEVIVVDYGSQRPQPIVDLCNRQEAVYVRPQTNGEWSAARARNAGVAESKGDVILAADADMLFTPESLVRVVRQLSSHPQEIVILQCRDLPLGYSDEKVREEGINWARLTAIGQLRPRWGVGGLVGIRRKVWDRLRGWDERMHTYGGEDTDFAKRAQRAGSRIEWLDEPGVAMFHMWHPSATAVASRDEATKLAIAENRRIHTSDNTFARNRVSWRYLPTNMTPLVSVIVVDQENARGSRGFTNTLASVMGQTVSDIEVVQVTDSPVRTTDPRIRSVTGADVSVNGTFVSVAFAGDVWAHDRLETLLGAWEPGVGLISDRKSIRVIDGIGNAITQFRLLPADETQASSALVRTELLSNGRIQTHRWPQIVSSVAASGTGWRVLEPSHNFCEVDIETEEVSAAKRKSEGLQVRMNLQLCGLTEPVLGKEGNVSVDEIARCLLDGDDLLVKISGASSVIRASEYWSRSRATSWFISNLETSNGAAIGESGYAIFDDPLAALEAVEWAKTQGLTASIEPLGSRTLVNESVANIEAVVQNAERVHGSVSEPGTWVVVTAEYSDIAQIEASLRALATVTTVLVRRVQANETRTTFVLARANHEHRAHLAKEAAKLGTDGRVHLVDITHHQKSEVR